MKRKDIIPCCAMCEQARTTEDPDIFYCGKKKKELPGNHRCAAFFLDLTKHPFGTAAPLPLDPDSILQ